MKTLLAHTYFRILTRTRLIALKATDRLFTSKDHLWSRSRVAVHKEHHNSCNSLSFTVHLTQSCSFPSSSYTLTAHQCSHSSPTNLHAQRQMCQTQHVLMVFRCKLTTCISAFLHLLCAKGRDICLCLRPSKPILARSLNFLQFCPTTLTLPCAPNARSIHEPTSLTNQHCSSVASHFFLISIQLSPLPSPLSQSVPLTLATGSVYGLPTSSPSSPKPQ